MKCSKPCALLANCIFQIFLCLNNSECRLTHSDVYVFNVLILLEFCFPLIKKKNNFWRLLANLQCLVLFYPWVSTNTFKLGWTIKRQILNYLRVLTTLRHGNIIKVSISVYLMVVVSKVYNNVHSWNVFSKSTKTCWNCEKSKSCKQIYKA